MTKIKREALVMYSSKQMYDIVNDVNAYCTYLPNCQKSKIIEQTESLLVGQLTLGKGALNISFTTKNSLKPFESITLLLHDGPFKNLNGVWYFESLNERACKIRFELSFEANALFKLAAKTLLTQMADQMVQSFIKRADQLYLQ